MPLAGARRYSDRVVRPGGTVAEAEAPSAPEGEHLCLYLVLSGHDPLARVVAMPLALGQVGNSPLLTLKKRRKLSLQFRWSRRLLKCLPMMRCVTYP